MSTALSRFRLISILEGVSYILLLGIAMPLKYKWGMPEYVKITGWIHGVLFVLYMITLVNLHFANKWSIQKTFIGFIASLLPFAPFIFDAKVLKKEIPK